MARLLLFGGKGGVGKTTTSTATAIALADSGLKVLLVSSDPAHSISDSLGCEIGSKPTRIEEVEGLYAVELDPESRISEYIPKFSDAISPFVGETGDGIDPSEMVLPGLDEAMAFDELLKHLENPNWDTIVFDTAPTGHTLRFLALPEIIEKWADKIIKLHRVTGGIRAIMFGSKDSEKIRSELDKFQKRVLHVRRIISDPDVTRFTLVTIPEKMGVNETIRAYNSLQEFKIAVSGCVINRLTPNLEHEFIQLRVANESKYIDELREYMPDIEYKMIELKEEDVNGVQSLRNLASELHGEFSIEDGIKSTKIGFGLEVNRGYWRDENIVKLHMPGIDRNDLTLRSESGIVFVGVNGREHAIDFPREAKASEVTAKLDGDVLNLTFPSI